MKFDPEIHHRRSIRLKGYDYSRAGLYYITICCADRICRFGNIEMNCVGAGLAPALQSNAPAQNSIPTPAQIDDNNINERTGLNVHNRAGVWGVWAGASPAPTMILNEFGQIAYDELIKLPTRFNNMELNIFQIMPNHIHAIILLNDPPQSFAGVGAGIFTGAGASPAPTPALLNTPAPTIGMIIGAYKSLVSNACLEIYKSKNEKMGKLLQRNYYEHIIRDEMSLYNITEYIMNNPVNWEKDEFFGSEL